MRFGEILARLEQAQFYRRWRRLSERGMAPPPPESDLSFNPYGAPGPWYINGPLTIWQNQGTASVVNEGGILVGSDGEVLIGFIGNGNPYFQGRSTAGVTGINFSIGGNFNFAASVVGGPVLQIGGASGIITKYGNGVSTVGAGVPPERGIDDRTAVASVDGAAITVYAVVTANKGLRLTARVFGFSGTVSAASYVVTWVEGGATITKTLSISAVHTDADLAIGIQPDTGTNITAQLTVLTGASGKVNVLCLVEGIGTGT